MKKTLLLLAVTANSLFNAQANATYLSRVNLVQQTNIENYNAALVGFVEAVLPPQMHLIILFKNIKILDIQIAKLLMIISPIAVIQYKIS